MPCCKPKRNTTYHQKYNALSALEVHTVGKIQCLSVDFVYPAVEGYRAALFCHVRV
jgi:hypothetical protein